MAYTIEEIDKALGTRREEWSRYNPPVAEFIATANYAVITDYLTGVSTSLHGLDTGRDLMILGNLVNLLSKLENPTPDEQLVLDVLNDPLVRQHTMLLSWLHHYTIEHPTADAFQAVVQQLRQAGMSDLDMFNFFILDNIRSDQSPTDDSIEGTPLKEFLSGMIKNSPQLIFPKRSYLSWGGSGDWSYVYFKLLDELRPDLAPTYALYGAQQLRAYILGYLIHYKQGSYIPLILQHLQDDRSDSKDLQQKFSMAILFYEIDPVSHRDLVIDLSRRYLANFRENPSKDKWEREVRLAIFKEKDPYSIKFSSAAWYFILQDHREEALEMLREWQREKVFVPYSTLAVLYYEIAQEALPYLQDSLVSEAAASTIEYFRSVLGLLVKHFAIDQWLPQVWKLTGSKSKPVREEVAKILVEKDGEVEKKAIALLENKNANSRQTAAIILSMLSSEAGRAAIIRILNKEASDTARDILLETVKEALATESSRELVEEMVQAAADRGKLGKPVETWLVEGDLPGLVYENGQALDERTVRFLLYRMSRIKTMRPDIEAKYVLRLVDKERSGPFAMALMKLFVDLGGEPDDKYLMALAALLGDDAVVDKIRIRINQWIEGNRYKMAEHGVSALALQGSDKALRWVEWYSRKYRNKKANVGAAALVALETAAAELGISTHELGDRVVPDFGFDGLFKNFVVSTDSYRAFIDSNFKIAYFDEDNKKLKALPSGADAVLKEEFKAIAKEVRDIVKSQSSRLEYYLIIQRKWGYEAWRKFFLQNPVMFIYATRLLWGVYDVEGGLQQTWLCGEDTELMDINDDEVTLADGALIGIVHPSQLEPDMLSSWQKKFYELNLSPIFPQLDRRIPDLSDLDLSKSILKKFDGRLMQDNSITTTLDKFGWHKGPTVDGGYLESYNCAYPERNWEAVLELDGVGAGYGWGGEQKLGRLYVVDRSKMAAQRWFRRPENDEDPQLVLLREVPRIFLHELLAAIESIKPKDIAV